MALTMSVTWVARAMLPLIRCERSPRPVSVGVNTLWPRSLRRSATRRQHQPPCQAQWTRTKVMAFVCAPAAMIECSGPLLALLLHIGAQHCVHASLISGALVLEEVEHVLVDTNRNGLLFWRNHDDRFGPIALVEIGPLRIAGHRCLDLSIREVVEFLPISLPAPRVAAGDDRDIFFFHRVWLFAPR